MKEKIQKSEALSISEKLRKKRKAPIRTEMKNDSYDAFMTRNCKHEWIIDRHFSCTFDGKANSIEKCVKCNTIKPN